MALTLKRYGLTAALVLTAAAGFAFSQTEQPMNDPAQSQHSHHTADGFRNIYDTGPRGSFLKWQLERIEKGLPKTPEGGYHFEVLRPDVARLKANRSEPTLTWIGHASFLLQLKGVNILTDPHLTARASPVGFAGPKRVVPPGLDFADLPHIDAVVISHNHYDHLDRETVRRLAAQDGGSPRFFVPLKLKAWFDNEGIHDVVELDWWDQSDFKDLKFTFVPAQHWSKRTLTDQDKTLWGGWVIEQPNFRFFFAGDTGYSPVFKDIGKRLGFVDLAAIPIGAYEPRWFMSIMHANPADAVKIHQDIHARHSVGMHWGTFVLTDEPLDEPPVKLDEARRAAGIAPDAFFVMKHGETRNLTALFGNK
jgi:N-acyl-phosphatidylethanolamine-hydrolysing phospholipase D